MYKFKNSTSEGSEEIEKHGKDTVYYFREQLNFREQTAGGNMDVKCTAIEEPEVNKEHAIENKEIV